MPVSGRHHKWGLLSAVIDDNNDIHCVGSYSDPGPPVIPQSKVYFKYEYLSNYWSDNTPISVNVSGGGSDIDIDQQNNPHIAWRQKTIDTGPYEDSTMYTFFNGTTWSEPELVVNDPYKQKIAIDPYNRVHIIDREKLETGTKLVHYQKINDLWQGYIIDEAENLTSFPDLTSANGQLYLLYNKSDIPEITDIYISKYDIETGIEQESIFSILNDFHIYPNPFKTQTTIRFNTGKQQQIKISIYDLNGKHINTIENKEFPPGTYKLKWNGTEKNRKEVNAGLYLIRLQTGRRVITKPVEYVK